MAMITLEPIAATAEGLDGKRYGRLLARLTPKVIETEAEHAAALAIVEDLMGKGDEARSAEEDAILMLVADLIDSYDKKIHAALPEGEPIEVLQLLMDSHGLKQIDLAPDFGSRGRVSDVFSGRRKISREQAKRLAVRFNVSPTVFL
jgi:HTH-type transcriptional regulator/antitoxin HigA